MFTCWSGIRNNSISFQFWWCIISFRKNRKGYCSSHLWCCKQCESNMLHYIVQLLLTTIKRGKHCMSATVLSTLWINTFHLHNNPARQVLSLSPFFVHEENGYREMMKLAQSHLANAELGTDSRTRVPNILHHCFSLLRWIGSINRKNVHQKAREFGSRNGTSSWPEQRL